MLYKFVYLLQTLKDHHWINKGWTNNNAESFNHILKQKTNWKKLHVCDLIDIIHDLVKLQVADLRRAIHGEGNFTLRPAFSHHSINYNVWQSKQQEQKDKNVDKFLQDIG